MSSSSDGRSRRGASALGGDRDITDASADSWPGKRPLTAGLQFKGGIASKALASAGRMQEVAARGVAGPGGALPHLAKIQAAFGRHDVSGISAHTGGAASEATGAIGAEAFATGNSVAFASAPDLHTAAHEAAHVVQQRNGVQLKGGIGEAGDTHEQHADAVADKVVAGQSAEKLLDAHAGGGSSSGGGAAVQRKLSVDLLEGLPSSHKGLQAVRLALKNYEVSHDEHDWKGNLVLLEAIKAAVAPLAKSAYAVYVEELTADLETELGKERGKQHDLASMLVRTGRSSGAATGGKLGGARTKEQDARTEGTASAVLMGMESATIENQQAHNAFGTKNLKSKGFREGALTHAYSGHGPASDQVSRLVHGRRGDELEHDEAEGTRPTGKVALSGNAEVGPVEMDAYTTVGHAPGNTSGAFSTNQGMLGVIGEAFAQANVFDMHRQKSSNVPTEIPVGTEGRFATTIATPDDIGYNLSVTGKSAQTRNLPLSKDEMQERYDSIERDPHQTNATVVLAPAFSGGKKVGWNLQTAYANTNAPSASYSKPDDVGGGAHDLENQKLVATQRIQAADAVLKDATGKHSKNVSGIKGRETGLAKAKVALAKDAANLDLQAKVAKMELELTAMRAETDDLKQKLDEATARRGTAQTQLKVVTDGLAKLKKSAPTAPDPDADADGGGGGGGGKAATAGYNAATGLWVTGRPEKPSDSASIKGTDKDLGTLTAHHLYPWNKIEVSLNAALGSKSRPELEKLFMFGEVTVGEEFWTELAKEPAERSYKFAEVLNNAVPRICWSPANIFMGPAPDKRGSDDPHENLDAAPTSDKQRLPQPASVLAQMLDKDGGIGKAGGLTTMLMRNMRDGGSEAQAYDDSQWKKQGTEIHRQGAKGSLAPKVATTKAPKLLPLPTATVDPATSAAPVVKTDADDVD